MFLEPHAHTHTHDSNDNDDESDTMVTKSFQFFRKVNDAFASICDEQQFRTQPVYLQLMSFGLQVLFDQLNRKLIEMDEK